MAKMTLTESRNLVKAIDSKAKRLYLYGGGCMSIADVAAIEKIMKKVETKLRSK